MTRRSWFTCGMLLIGAFVAGQFILQKPAVLAATEVGSGPITLPMEDDTQELFTNPTTNPACVTVNIEAGTAQVEVLVSGNWSSIGTVSASEACAFENEYASIRVKALSNGTTGAYTVRCPTDACLGPDYVVATSSTTLGTTPQRIYSNPTATARHVVITTGQDAVALRAAGTGSDLLVVPPECTFAYRGTCGEYWLSGTGPVAFSIMEDPEAWTAMLLPEAHWLDEFSATCLMSHGRVGPGDPTKADPVEENIGSREQWDAENEEYDTIYYIDNEALVEFTPTTTSATIRALFEDLHVDIDEAWFEPNPADEDYSISWFHVHVQPPSTFYGDVAGLISHLSTLSCVEYAGYNDLGEALGYGDGGDRDEYFGEYSEENEEFEVYAQQRELKYLSAQDAWDDKSAAGSEDPTVDTGEGVAVVVIDSGIQVVFEGELGNKTAVFHPDLQNKIYKDPESGEDLALIYVSQTKTYWTFEMDGKGNEYGVFNTPTTVNDFRHGTAVCGIIGADTYNGESPNTSGRGLGVAGAGPDLALFPAFAKWKKTSDGEGRPVASSVVSIIRTLSGLHPFSGKPKHPAVRVVNMSIGWKGKPAGLHKAIKLDRALNSRLYVAAAGDDGKEKKIYPAFWSDVVIGVTAANGGGAGEASNDNWAGSRGDGSNYYCGGGSGSSPQNYQVSAYWHAFTTDTEGEYGYSTGNGSPADADYAGLNGTSAAAAYVSAAAGLIYSRAIKKGRFDNGSNDVTPDDVTDMLVNNLKQATITIPQSETKNGNRVKRIPGVIDFKEAKNDL